MKTLLSAFVLLSSTAALAWGPTGHRVVGEIAEKYLEVKTLSKVREILKGESLARVSTWPDEIKSEPDKYSYTFNWHYTDWKDGDEHYHEEGNSGKLIESLDEQIATLKNENATAKDKAFALKFLVHLMGDLHMPLHVGNGVDQGGNFCRVFFQNSKSNLHAVWDEGMISFTNLSFTELAKFVTQTYSPNVSEYKKGVILDWALESKEIRQTIYPSPVVVDQTNNDLLTYCLKPYNESNENLPKLSYEYSYKFVPVLEKRLYQGGVRLAKVLNDIFSAN